jgi:hypothetical protein
MFILNNITRSIRMSVPDVPTEPLDMLGGAVQAGTAHGHPGTLAKADLNLMAVPMTSEKAWTGFAFVLAAIVILLQNSAPISP